MRSVVIVAATLLGCTQDFSVFTEGDGGAKGDGSDGSTADAACVPTPSCVSGAQTCAMTCSNSSCRQNCAQQCVLCSKATCDVSGPCKTAAGL